ncbi:hypothetical protein OSB04_025284 [Centaurea solstitialis]|uniref:Reverse transcriptase domain-containing protein n=1 Tax=Centaurea solstitialis TaxID=347529 RepID=A0AA38T6A7_9ASTR|nr:hypothetical protein OSB04_025284 [Centaurea solstitialis]
MTLKPDLIDGILVANEIVNAAKKSKMKMAIFKVDFEKVFDTVNWNFLIYTMEQMGFGPKWRKWIRGCLVSASISILVSESPTKELKMERGLRQGDPLSPFLFLIAGEALQQMTIQACSKGLFKGLNLANTNRNLSLLQFADDAVFFGKWSSSNIRNLTKLLKCFYEVSGLKINLAKCSLMGIGVDVTEVQRMAQGLQCKVEKLPFLYLGMPVGINMRRKAAWSEVYNKFNKKLSCWKSKLLSHGGSSHSPKFGFNGLASLILLSVQGTGGRIRRRFFWGFNEGDNKIHWISWKKVLLPNSLGGLGVASLKAKNMALLCKWYWLYGEMLSLDSTALMEGLKTTHLIPEYGIDFCSSFSKIIADGSTTKFWTDVKVGNAVNLKTLFPKLFALETNKEAMFKECWQFFNEKPEADLSQHLPSELMDTIVENPSNFTWNSLLPIKVNLFMWTLLNNGLPRNCLFCDGAEESGDHCFFSCPISINVWRKVWAWCDHTNASALQGKCPNTVITHAIYSISLCSLWSWRNRILHGRPHDLNRIKQEDLFPSIQNLSALWVGNMGRSSKINWSGWCKSPLGS